MDFESVKKAVIKEGSKRGALVALGYHRNNSTALKKLSKIIEENDLNKHLSHLQNRRKGADWSEENVKGVVSKSKTYTEALIAMGVAPRGDSIPILKEKIKKYNIDTSHFDRYHKHRKSNEEMFIVSKTVRANEVKKKFLTLVPYKCSNPKCGLSEWLGEPICLEMDHINGIYYDHRFENLRLLCPNCHTQTPTHNRGASKEVRLKFKDV